MIITIARECGCYGDLIGEKLGEKLGIPVYDKKSVTQMAKEAGIYSKYPNFFSEKQANEFLAAIISDECETVKDTPRKALSAVIKDESFLLIGRCGNFAYGTDHNVLRIFLSGNRQIRVGNIMKKHNVNVREAEKTVDSVLHNRLCSPEHGLRKENHLGKFLPEASAQRSTDPRNSPAPDRAPSLRHFHSGE